MSLREGGVKMLSITPQSQVNEKSHQTEEPYAVCWYGKGARECFITMGGGRLGQLVTCFCLDGWRLYRRRQEASQNPINLPACQRSGTAGAA